MIVLIVTVEPDTDLDTPELNKTLPVVEIIFPPYVVYEVELFFIGVKYVTLPVVLFMVLLPGVDLYVLRVVVVPCAEVV